MADEQDKIPPTPAALKEALDLSTEILSAIELNQVPLSILVLRASRLARLLNDFIGNQIFVYESGGYPSEGKGIKSEIFEIMRIAGRTFKKQIRMTMLKSMRIRIP